MIFILVRKIAGPVALVVAWIAVSAFAMVKSLENNNAQIKIEQTLAANIAAAAEAEEKAEVEAEKTLLAERGTVTSRSGARTDRTQSPIYYEQIGINVADNEIEVLERIVEAEAGGSGYDGMLAVANVVLNRVASDRFPNTVTDVVFARRQFTPTSDGRYYSITVSDTAKQVVKDALNGARIVNEEALYFCTPTASGKSWFETSLKKLDYIAPHNFYGYKD